MGNKEMKDKIVEEVTKLLNEDFTKIIITLRNNGFSIIPTKEIKRRKE